MLAFLQARRAQALVVAAAAAAGTLAFIPSSNAATAGTDVISGTVWYDTNRNGVVDPGETPIANATIQLYASGGTFVAGMYTDANGRYSFGGLADGQYRVNYGSADWAAMQANWTPTTNGSLYPFVAVTVSGAATVNFGWRQIVRSSTPITHYVGPTGITVDSYDDVVSAQSLYQDLAQSSLIGNEAPTVTIAFDHGSNSDLCSYSVGGTQGSYSGYSALAYVSWAQWLSNGDTSLFHEYGHAWSMYYAYVVQQDSTLTSYLQARGILNDPRLDTSHAWDRHELIAEDYRQLFGPTSAQSTPQENTDLPPASAVPGLKTFLASTFTTGSSSTTTSASPTPTATTSSPSASPSPTATSSPTPTSSPSPTATTSPSPTPTSKKGKGH